MKKIFGKFAKTALMAMALMAITMTATLPAAAEESVNEDFLDSGLYITAQKEVDRPIQAWYYDDFDGDGLKEVFCLTGEEDYDTEDAEKSLYYFGDDGNYECLIYREQYWYMFDEPFDAGGCKLLYIGARHGYRMILGVKNDKAVEVAMPDDADFYWVSLDNETGLITAGDKRDEEAHVLAFDYESMKLTDTGEKVSLE